MKLLKVSGKEKHQPSGGRDREFECPTQLITYDFSDSLQWKFL